MNLSVAIVGLPNVGKSTLFKALTRIKVDIAPYPFTTIKPNLGIVQVPDKRLKKIAQIVKSEKITPAIIEFVDIAGLIKGAHKGEGLGNQFLAEIRNCQAILEVVKAFTDNENPAKPENDIEIIKTELEMKDLEIKERKAKSEQTQEIKPLANKPIIYLLNIDGKSQYLPPKREHLTINIKEEEEFSQLSQEEKKELKIETKLDQLILACYNVLDLVTFYTIRGGKETRAWALKRGTTAPLAGEVVHSDFKEKFIKAEVINWQEFIKAGGWKQAQEKGQIKLVGKDYLVQDGDIIDFKI